MSSVFKLDSDKLFVRTSFEDNSEILVCEYEDDPYHFGMIYASGWKQAAVIGKSSSYNALEVYGVKIEGIRLQNLIKELTMTDKVTGHQAVNRQGLCVLYVGGDPVKLLRVNDRFSWSKYGVHPPAATSSSAAVWSVCDMSSSAVLVDRSEAGKKEAAVAAPKAAL